MRRAACLGVLLLALASACGGESEEAAVPETTTAPQAGSTEAISPERQWLSDFSAWLLDIEFATARMGSLPHPATVFGSQHARTRVGAGANLLAGCSGDLPADAPPTDELEELARLGELACTHFERASKQILEALAKKDEALLRNALRPYRAGKKVYEEADALLDELRAA